MIFTLNAGLSCRSVLPRDWIRSVRPASRWSYGEARCHHVCERTGAQCDQVNYLQIHKTRSQPGRVLNERMALVASLSRPTGAGRETSGGMWRTETMSPAGLFTAMERASSTEMQQTTLCQASLNETETNSLRFHVQHRNNSLQFMNEIFKSACTYTMNALTSNDQRRTRFITVLHEPFPCFNHLEVWW